MAQSIKLGNDTYLDQSGVNLGSRHIDLGTALTWTSLWSGSVTAGGSQITLSRGARMWLFMIADSANSSSTRSMALCPAGNFGTRYIPVTYANNPATMRITSTATTIKIEAVSNANIYLKAVYGLL